MLTYLRPHTKVRRLGYIKLLVAQYFKSDFHSISTFSLFFEKTASDRSIRQQLDEYFLAFKGDDKGIIELLGTGASADPYIKFAEELSILARVNYSYVLTKKSKVYKTIYETYLEQEKAFKYIQLPKVIGQLDIFKISSTNIFTCNTLDKLFFLGQFLETDFLFLKCILRIISEDGVKDLTRNAVKYFSVKERFVGTLVDELSLHLTSSEFRLTEKSDIIQMVKKFERNVWKIRTYESVIEPRISWLLDLEIIDRERHQMDALALSACGEKLYKVLRKTYNIQSWFDTGFFKLANDLYGITQKNDEMVFKRFEKYIEEAFHYFKTLAPGRITASQAIYYCCLASILKDGIVAEYDDVRNYLFKLNGKGYIVDWFPSENDGSLKRIDK